MKKLSKFLGFALSALMMVGAVVGFKPSLHTANAEAATMAVGTNASTATVNEVAAIKVGTGKAGGTMTITAPAGAVSLSFYAAAWNGVNDLSLSLDPAEKVSVTSIDLLPDTGISGNSPFTLSGSESSFEWTVGLTNITENTIITLSGSKRFVVWGASYTLGGGEEDLPDGFEEGIAAKQTYFSLSYSFNEVETSSLDAGFARISNVDEVVDGSEVIVISKNNGKYYALSNNVNSTSQNASVPLEISESNISSSTNSSIIWNVETVDGGVKLLSNTSKLNHNNSSNALTMTSSGGIFTVNYDNESGNSYFGYSTTSNNGVTTYRALYYCSNGDPQSSEYFKGYAVSTINTTSGSGSNFIDYADNVYIYVKNTPSRFSNVDFKLRIATDSLNNFATTYSCSSYGLELTQDSKQPVRIALNSESKSGKAFNGNDVQYYVLSLGDVLNNPERLTAVFTLKSYVILNGVSYTSNNLHSSTHSVKSLLTEYLTKHNNGDIQLGEAELASLNDTIAIVNELTAA